MEKIKQAIAKAQSVRITTEPPSTEKVKAEIPRVSPATNQDAAAEEHALENLEYTNTKIIQLNPSILERNRVVAFDKSNKISSMFDLLRTQVLQKMEENGWRSIAAVSPTAESGKTFVSINLAMSIAHQPKKSVMLVDFDLRRPKVATYLGLQSPVSMNDYLAGNADFPDILVNPGIPKMVVIPTNKPVARSAEILSTEKVKSFIKEVKDRYHNRILVVDLPPVLAVDDSMIVLPQVDCVLMVVSNGVNNEKEILETKRRLQQYNLIGVVFNKAEVIAESYYY